MKMNTKSIFFLLLAMLVIPSCDDHNSSSSESLTPPNDSLLSAHDEIYDFYDNSIALPSVGGGEATLAADPFVFRYNGMYYLYATTSNGFVRGYQSEDMIHWEKVNNGELTPGYVYDYSRDPNRPASSNPFAPEVTYYNGNFYMIMSPSGNGHYVLKSKNPDGPFEAVSGNIGHSIDGHYFIDNNDGEDEVYMFYAGGGGINITKMEKDFYSLKKENGSTREVTLLEAKIGGWNEGPYMLKKDGNYYLTFTGSHYLTPSYRVDYAFVPSGEDIMKNSSYTNKGHVLVNTDNRQFMATGHSSTVLGPDLDSYYIVYHNLTSSNQRFYNFSRLSFNGARMVANSVRLEENIAPNLPEFSSYEGEGMTRNSAFLLSNFASEDTFSAEYNVSGTGKMIFAYQDDNNYGYAQISDDCTLNLYQVSSGNTSEITSINFNSNIDPYVNHTVRLSYRNGLMDLYFDTMEMANDISCSFSGGKVGIEEDAFDEYGYLAFSNVGNGSSDNLAYNTDIILANAYDEERSYLTDGSGLVEVTEEGEYLDTYSYNLNLKNQNDRAVYRVYIPSDATEFYNLEFRLPATSLNKKIGVRLDDGEIINYTIKGETPTFRNGDVTISLNDFYIPEGQHYLSVYNVGDEVSFSKIELKPCYDAPEFDLDFASETNYTTVGNLSFNNNSVSFSEQIAAGALYNNDLVSGTYTIEANVKVSSIGTSGYAGLLFNAKYLSEAYREDADRGSNANSFNGYRLQFEDGALTLNYVDFNNVEYIDSYDLDISFNRSYDLYIELVDNTITVYLGEDEVISTALNIGPLSGKVGFMAMNSSGEISNFSVY